MKFFYCFIFSSFIGFAIQAQTTIGLLYHDQDVSDGYLLMSNRSANNVFLINQCGEFVNQWTFSGPSPVNYLLENGNVLMAGRNLLEIRDWDDNPVWAVDVRDFGLEQHHDVEYLPNGNILILMRDYYTPEEAIAQGRRADLVAGIDEFESEKIIEVQPIGTNQLAVVWEWKFWNHLIQDNDNTKPNFGIISDHPELIDLNIETQSNVDWLHTNSIDYNEALDQIVVSVRHTSEIYIIDHSTTTAEAASHSGGNSGVGGDFLWRWGNPQMYGQGDENDRKLYGQHDSRWIPEGYPSEGMISVFSNGFERSSNFSSVHLIDTQVDTNGDYQLTNGIYEPLDFSWSWDGEILGITMFSNSQSGANMQPNGNFVICEATSGRISEITQDGDLMWSYLNPVSSNTVLQNEMMPFGQNVVFKSEKYPENYAGFIGRDLTITTGIYENENIISEECIALLSVQDEEFVSLNISPNPFTNHLQIQIPDISVINSIELFNVTGQKINDIQLVNQTVHINQTIAKGLYFVRIKSKNNSIKTFKLIKS